MNLKGRHFLKLIDYTPEEIIYLVDLAERLKKEETGHNAYLSGREKYCIDF